MFMTLYSVTCCIYVPGKPGICFNYYCAVYDDCKYSDTFWLADRTRLFVQYTILLASLCKLILRHWTYKMPVRYILSSVWARLSIFSPLIHYTICGAVCFQFTHFSCDDWQNICIYIFCLIIIIKWEVWTITPLVRVRSWNNVVSCMSFYILMCTTLVSLLKICATMILSNLKNCVIPRNDMMHIYLATKHQGFLECTHLYIYKSLPRNKTSELMI